ncbi:hypothetical protein HZC09_00865 [Candidatus Micrarchaeota archaeon]|nr:hypothetical protein [Candidatus Micrarchaeota archaeon]
MERIVLVVLQNSALPGLIFSHSGLGSGLAFVFETFESFAPIFIQPLVP